MVFQHLWYICLYSKIQFHNTITMFISIQKYNFIIQLHCLFQGQRRIRPRYKISSLDIHPDGNHPEQASVTQRNQSEVNNKEHCMFMGKPIGTVLPAKSDSDVMFCSQSYQGLIMDRSLVY